MKSTDQFKKVIEARLQEMAAEDPAFAEKLKNEKKNIELCITYILTTVQKSGCNGFTDDEIFGMAAHYYDEENIEVGSRPEGKVVINHKPELTADEINEAKEAAIREVINEERNKMRAAKSTIVKKQEPTYVEQTLF